MMRLNNFQNSFKELMLDHPDALHDPPEELAAFLTDGNIALADRLSVYRSNIVGGLTDVIVESFPVIKVLVGKDFLEGMARGFVLEKPPARGCLHYYGAGFAEFIERFDPAKDLPYLPDVARLELALGQAYHAENDTPMCAAALSTITPEDLGNLQLFLRESVRLISSPYPVQALRDFCLSDQQGQAPSMDSGQGETHLMVYRPAYNVEIIQTAPDEHMMLGALQGGQSLGGAVEDVLGIYEDFDFAAFLQKHMALETFLPLDTNA